ncbi:MAG: hypothetical protein CVV53_01010 [Spirochaetae bacterium HGW-Spirochaetae-9]|nr:MAG: hypothetical protein CVV53_01010 [Spirochaetae bacterium HGW-Spirochaetae-9]
MKKQCDRSFSRNLLIAVAVAALILAPSPVFAQLFPGIPNIGSILKGAVNDAAQSAVTQAVATTTTIAAPVPEEESTDDLSALQPLIALPEPSDYSPEVMPDSASPSTSMTPEQRAQAVALLDVELEAKKLLLPKWEKALTRTKLLQIAKDRHDAAKAKFTPEETVEYARLVTWSPKFDGNGTNPSHAKNVSLQVSLLTNYLVKPNFVTAFATAAYSLDPDGTNAANNVASAILGAGERANPDPAVSNYAKQMGPYRGDAEAFFIFSVAASMKAGSFVEASMTPLINLGNLYIDLRKNEEARSLFMVARGINRRSWEAALGLSAYFLAIGKPDKARTILDDDRLDRPAMYMVAKKTEKLLQETEKAATMPVESPPDEYEELIRIAEAQPMLTSADFIAQLDQSERNKMRYFIENLPPQGSYKVPPITMVAQFSNLQAISAPAGISALRDFSESISGYMRSSFAQTSDAQLAMLKSLGLDIDPGIDMKDAAAHPEKYENTRPNVTVENKEQFKADMLAMKGDATMAKADLAAGNTGSTIALAARLDPFVAILQIEPTQFADPMNIMMQKYNFAVHNRKFNLYNNYLYSVNKKASRQIREVFNLANTNHQKIAISEEAAMERERQYQESKSKADDPLPPGEAALRFHEIHVQYKSAYNSLASASFSQATQIASVAYLTRIKPTAEKFYYDVMRHVALITDPAVRVQRDVKLRTALSSAVGIGLQNVLMAYGSLSWMYEWECSCNVQGLMQMREEEQAAREDEENARVLRNMNAKKQFDSGEIPESSPLWKKLDAFGTDLNIPFIPFLSGRISCARTVVRFNFTLPIPGMPQISTSMTRSENTGAATYGAGVKLGYSKEVGSGSVGANLSLSGTVSTDGQGTVSNYSVTAGTDVSVSVKGGTTVKVGGEITFGPNGASDSDFSAGISQDFKGQTGGTATAGFEASTKRGCTLSGKVEQNFQGGFADDVKKASTDKYGATMTDYLKPEDALKQSLWSGEYKIP